MKYFDLFGIGAGPANLSLAALSVKAPYLKAYFCDSQPKLIWHQGMLISDSKLQVSYLKDLVTLVDPTNPYSFLNFLHQKGCLYQFITSDFQKISRLEFSNYLNWVFNSLDSVHGNEQALSVEYSSNKSFIVTTSKDVYETKNLVLGNGLSPYTPECCLDFINEDIFHNSQFLYKQQNFADKRVAVIGGGQSGAEILLNLISDNDNRPSEIYWFSKAQNFLPIDDSPFTNELFTPQYMQYFYALPNQQKQSLLEEHRLASDGISNITAQEIYRKLYEFKFIKDAGEEIYLLPSHKLTGVVKHKDEYLLTIDDLANNKKKDFKVDKAILCTGYKHKFPNYLSNLKNKIHVDNNDNLVVNTDYSLSWDNTDNCSIYIQNGARHSHGIADPNLSLLAYRSAIILNTIAKQDIYQNLNGSSLVHWGLDV